MTESSADFADACGTPDLGPLTLVQDGDRWRFTLTAPLEMLLELPSNYERQLTERLARLLETGRQPDIVMDLESLPGLSSRQLGLMLALHKALRERCERLPVTGISAGVRHLLNLTKTAQFFDFS